MKIKLWGTRGSIPTPSTSAFLTNRYGGDTTCLSIEFDDQTVILDGGSGLRLLGMELTKRKPCRASFFFTHVHWDHIQGFPFFIPGFVPGNHFDLYGPPLANTHGFVGNILEKALRGQQEDLNFPVQLADMPASMTFRDLVDGEVVVIKSAKAEMRVSAAPLNHPGGCFGYRLEEHRPGQPVKVFCLATDTEHLAQLNPNVQKIAKDADVLVYDAQYTPEEYDGIGTHNHIGWGHSTWAWAIKEGKAAGAKKVLLTHHDPLHDDATIARIEEAAQAHAKREGIEVQAAAQFMEIEI